jgi:hypothetical protein
MATLLVKRLVPHHDEHAPIYIQENEENEEPQNYLGGSHRIGRCECRFGVADDCSGGEPGRRLP